jgi:hypothetical protein
VNRGRRSCASATIDIHAAKRDQVAEYAFVTTWRIDAPIEPVYDAIRDSLAWPGWWDAVLAVEDVAPGDEAGIGNVRRYTFKGRLPYLLRFDLTTDVVQRPERLGGTAVGELEGRGDWTLRPDGPAATLVRYDWLIRTTRPWMNALSPFPFVRAIFELNHDYVMDRGLVGIRRHLSVPGRAVPPATVERAGARGPADGADQPSVTSASTATAAKSSVR